MERLGQMPERKISELTLVCLPHAGGSATAFSRWSAAFDPAVTLLAIDYPGRGGVAEQAPLTHWPALIDAVLQQVIERLAPDGKVAVFGHSMGALVGIELAYAMRERHDVSPIWLGVSGAVAPALRQDGPQTEAWLRADRQTMVAALRKLGGTPEALLTDRDFIDFVMPVLRADFHLCGIHPAYWRESAKGRRPLDCPIDLFCGIDDIATADATQRNAWRDETTGPFQARQFSGDHFYLTESPEPLWSAIASSLRGIVRPAR